MPVRLWFLLLLLGSVLLPVRAAQRPDDVTVARNLQLDGRLAMHRRIPVLIVFTQPDCTYCDRVIHYYLVPMQRNPAYAGTLLIRRLDITSAKKLVDFQGRPTTDRAFAKSLKVGFAPTVMVFTPAGEPGAKPLVGLGPEDYYGGFIDQAVDATRRKMHATGQ